MRRVAVGIPFAVLVSACVGGAAQVARPKEKTFDDVMSREGCTLGAGRNEPFVVDWPADKRSDLEVALKQRIPVVSYDCKQLRVLDECELDGSYRFVGVTQKEEAVRLDNSDEVRANLPFSGAGLVGKLGGELERGSTIDIAFSIIGKRTSTRARVARDQLRGECAGATHFVRGMTLGAFAMSVGTRAKVVAVADVFQVAGGKAGSASSRDAKSRDGDLAACKTSTPDADAPTPQCGAVIKLDLRTIGAPENTPAAVPSQPTGKPAAGASPLPPDATPVVCPFGLVATELGTCAHASPATPHVCNPTDPSECEAECGRGSATSCALFARMLQLGNGVKKDDARAVKLYDQACAKGSMPACGRLGELFLAAKHDDEGGALLKRSCEAGWVTACDLLGKHLLVRGAKTDVFALFKRACDGGDAEGCWSLGLLFREGLGVRQNDAESIRHFQLACEGGAKLGCVDFAKLLDAGRGAPADTPRAVRLLEGSCDRGFSDACDALSLWHFTGHGVAKDVAKGVVLLQRACDGTAHAACFVLGQRYENGVGVTRDPARALPLYERACSSGFVPACEAALALKPKPATP